MGSSNALHEQVEAQVPPLEVEQVGITSSHCVTQCHCRQVTWSTWTAQLGAHTALCCGTVSQCWQRWEHRPQLHIQRVKILQTQLENGSCASRSRSTGTGRKNKAKGECLLPPALPTAGLMLVSCRKAARAGQSTLPHLMLSQPFMREQGHE